MGKSKPKYAKKQKANVDGGDMMTENGGEDQVHQVEAGEYDEKSRAEFVYKNIFFEWYYRVWFRYLVST